MEDLNPRVLISILNWNAPTSTSTTVNSVLHHKYINYEILIIDNCSADDSVKVLKLSFPDLKVIKVSENLGYAGAHKISAKYAVDNNFDLLWILNNDVEVFPETLSNLVLSYQRNGAAVFGSVSLKEDAKTVHFGGGDKLIDNSRSCHFLSYEKLSGRNILNTPMEERQVADVEGASMMIPVSVIIKYGFMDTRFFLYGEETDYCYHLRTKYNISTLIVPSSLVIHSASKSFALSPRLKYIKAYYINRNTNIVCRKYLNDYKIYIPGGYRYLIRFFLEHYIIKKITKDDSYWITYYTNLGYLHALLRLKGKYLKPEKFI